MKPFVIRQGDHLAKLAYELGFDADEVWNDPNNAALREKRKPNLLHPGDVLQVPDQPKKELRFEPSKKNGYRAKVPTLDVHLVFADEGGPMKDEPYEVRGIDAPAGKTDAAGKLTLKVPVNVRELVLHFTKRNVVHTVQVGDMDPIEEISGVDKRLQHLGFLPPPPNGDSALRRSAAIRAFQASAGLPVTGAIDDDTRSALVTAHGS